MTMNISIADKLIPDEMLTEIDFSKGVRSLHPVPIEATVFVPALIERSVWEYFSGRAQQKGVQMLELLTEILRRDIEISEALK